MRFDYHWICNYLESAPPLDRAAEVLNQTGLETEAVDGTLDIEHTYNRGDAMSHFGVARELAVKLGLELIAPPIYSGAIAPLTDWRIEPEDHSQCPRYIALKIDGVSAVPSPAWLVERLTAIGQTSHNLLVDLTNFLLWEYGHPCHAFDAKKLHGNKILVRFGHAGERLTTLDGRSHDAADLLCIADSQRPIAFAGVMGGENTEVDSGTTSLLLEVAVFRPGSVRQTGRRCRIESDARHRFERGVDKENMERVVRRFVYLLQREQPSIYIAGMADAFIEPFNRTQLVLRRERTAQILGVRIADEEVFRLLQRMDCRPEPIPEGWRTAVPGYKTDVTREIDLIEEIIRFAGLELLPSQLPSLAGSSYRPAPVRDGINALRRQLVADGLLETNTYAFLAEGSFRLFDPESEPLRLRNPMSENQAVMRRHLLPSLLECVRRNHNRGIHELAFFEIAHVYEGEGEPSHLAVAWSPEKVKTHWWRSAGTHPFYYIKGLLEHLVERFGWTLTLRQPAPVYLNGAEALGIYADDRLIGGLGTPADHVLRGLDIEHSVAVLEMDLSFLAHVLGTQVDVAPLPVHPGIQVDMAFVLDKQHSYRDVRGHIDKLTIADLERIDLFDVYEGKSLGQGKVSLGFRFSFQAADRSLTSEEVSRSIKAVVESVQSRFGAIVRE